MKKIAILVCYFGKFPWYFKNFLHSCGFNPDIDFYIVTNIEERPEDKPANVHYVLKSIEAIRSAASKKLGFEVDISFPYKLCDFKPAYGVIFSEIIRDHEFWGHSDLDIIYGNIRKFMTDKLLDRYDYISIRHDYTTGCFALYKNTPRINNFFKKSRDYKMVFSSRDHYCFDECNFVQDFLTEGKSIFDLETRIESFTHIVKRAQLNNEIRAHFDFILMEGLPGRIRFENGKITYKKKFEVILYHLYWFKQIYTPKLQPEQIPDTYRISPTRIYY